MQTYHRLTPEEERIIVHKGTEPPGSGQYDIYSEAGIYLCRRCDAPLFLSSAKFHSGCGWPSFDEEIPQGLVRQPDGDGRRTEIMCARCHAHLGHVFLGEEYTGKNTRHCVNSRALRHVLARAHDGKEYAIFAAGCFWNVEQLLKQASGVVQTVVGYVGGHVIDPTYEQVCSGKTGHVEAVELLFDPTKTEYAALCRLFFTIHDPSQQERHPQYRSNILYLTVEQRNIALACIEMLRQEKIHVTTTVRPSSLFYPAEAYHQGYYSKQE